MPYKFIDNVAIADVAFEASGKTIEELFESAGNALTNTMVKKLKTVELKEEKNFELKADSEEKLLHGFLQELIYYKDANLLLFREYKINISKEGESYILRARLKGEQLDMKKHELLVDVKAVSWHMFKIEKSKSGWNAFVILDV
jgi:SHS2 domain-containing protein